MFCCYHRRLVFLLLIRVLGNKVFSFQDPWNEDFKLLARFDMRHCQLRPHVQPSHIFTCSLLKVVIISMHGDLSFGVTLVVLKCNHFQLRDLNPREQFFEDVTRHACDDWDLKYSEMDSFASLSYDQQLSHVESSPCFAVLTQLRVFQVDYFVTYVMVSQGWSPLKHRLWITQ